VHIKTFYTPYRNLLFVVILAVTTLFYSCNEEEKEISGTYIGGQIINPYSSFIRISKDRDINDTISLNQNNRFLYTIKDNEEGIYRFSNGEYQTLYVEPGDSILLRVNTVEFDESLSFSGPGSSKNNFLIEMYLHSERENRNFGRFYNLKAKAFEEALDSMLSIRERMLEKYEEKHELSDGFREYATAVVYYDTYQRKESYPFSHFSKDKKKEIDALPEDFYSFRESVNINNLSLQSCNAYIKYLIRYFDHMAFLEYSDSHSYNTLSYVHNEKELKLIDSLITEPELKDELLHITTRNFILNSNNQNETADIYQLFKRYATSQDVIADITKRFENNKKLEAGNTLPDQFIIAADKRVVTLSSIINKPTVLYFWSHRSHQYSKRVHAKVEELKVKYPDYDFIGINTEKDKDGWIKNVRSHNFDVNKEYQFIDPSDARNKFLLNTPNKIIVLDRRGRILNSHTSLFNIAFEQELLGYLNK